MADPVLSNINSALAAYSKAARSTEPGPVEPPAAVPGGDDFAGLVRSAIDEAVAIGQRSEQLSMAAVADKADLDQVVTAVAEAEVTLRTVVAVRDKVLEAYREIIKMPI